MTATTVKARKSAFHSEEVAITVCIELTVRADELKGNSVFKKTLAVSRASIIDQVSKPPFEDTLNKALKPYSK